MAASGKMLGALFAVVVVILLGWGVFLMHLDLESMWRDEYISWSIARSATIGDLFAQYPAASNHPPGYYLWLWAWMKWTGSSDLFLLRLSAAIPAALAIAGVYRLGVGWFKSRWIGLGAAAFVATSGMMIYYARELRMYTLITLLGLASWWLWERVLGAEKLPHPPTLSPTQVGRGGVIVPARRQWLYIAAYGVVVAVMAYTHYLSIFAVATQGIAALIFYRRQFLRLIPAYLLAAAAFAPWIPMFLTQSAQASVRSGRDGSLTVGNFGQFLGNRPTNLDTIETFFHLYTAGQQALVGLLVALALILGLGVGSPRVVRRRLIVVCVWFAGMLALVWAVNLVIPVYNPRYVLPVLPALALLIGVAVEKIPAPAQWAVVVIVGAAALATHTQAFLAPKTPHRELLTTIEARRLPGDRIWYNLASGAQGSSIDREVSYYLTLVTPDLTPEMFIWEAEDEFADYEAVRRVWDVRPYWIGMDAGTERNLKTGRAISERYDFDSFTVRLYEPPPQNQSPARFGDLFELLRGDIPATYRAGETVLLKLWWRALDPISLDYSYGLYLRDEMGRVAAQVDTGLALGKADSAKPTSQWTPSDEFTLVVPEFALPGDLPPGKYGLWLGVYYWETPTPLAIWADGAVVDDGANVIRVAEIVVE